MERDVTVQQSLSAVGRCLRQPRHTPLIILLLNTEPLTACLYACAACVCPCVHKWSAQSQSSRTEDQNVAEIRFCRCGELAVGRAGVTEGRLCLSSWVHVRKYE